MSDTESDDDFLSADEGDDEIINRANKVKSNKLENQPSETVKVTGKDENQDSNESCRSKISNDLNEHISKENEIKLDDGIDEIVVSTTVEPASNEDDSTVATGDSIDNISSTSQTEKSDAPIEKIQKESVHDEDHSTFSDEQEETMNEIENAVSCQDRSVTLTKRDESHYSERKDVDTSESATTDISTVVESIASDKLPLQEIDFTSEKDTILDSELTDKSKAESIDKELLANRSETDKAEEILPSGSSFQPVDNFASEDTKIVDSSKVDSSDTSNVHSKVDDLSKDNESELKTNEKIDNKIVSENTNEGKPCIPSGKLKENCGDSTTDDSNSWGWDSWADDFISGAATKVSSLLETVEGQLGIPDPVEMAKTVKKESDVSEEKSVDKQSNTQDDTQSSEEINSTSEGVSSWFSSFVPVSSLTNMMQPLGQDFVAGSIDALEFIGKKTVSIISDGDPGLRSKRQNLFKKQTLSAVLNEAKESSKATQGEKKENSFAELLEKFQGTAHLDGLEMLSNDSDGKLQRILKLQSDEVKGETMELLKCINEKFNIDDSKSEESFEGDFKKEMFLHSKRLKLKVTCSKLLNTWTKLNDKTKDENSDNFQTALLVFAEFLSRCIEFHRKVGDMLILTDMDAKEMCLTRAEHLKLITEAFQMQVSKFTKLFVDKLLEDGGEENSQIITDLYLECSNCQSFLCDSHNLLLPILQCSVVK